MSYKPDIPTQTDIQSWLSEMKPLLAARIPTRDIDWPGMQQGASLFDVFTDKFISSDHPTHEVHMSQDVKEMVSRVLCHRSPERHQHIYHVVLALQDNAHILSDPRDPSIRWVKRADQAVRRDIHKMHAFVRFQKCDDIDGQDVFSAWFEPSHRIVGLTAPFFMRRFTGMVWHILTPDLCAHWDRHNLSFSRGVSKSLVEAKDEYEEVWRTYYRSIFNPSRLKVSAMQAEMPKKYWKNLPEAELIHELITKSEAQTRAFLEAAPTHPSVRTERIKAQPFIPPDAHIE